MTTDTSQQPSPNRTRWSSAEQFAAVLDEMGAEPTQDHGEWWKARCIHPGHDDNDPSMHFKMGADDLVIRCFACSPDAGTPERTTWFRGVMEAARQKRRLPPPDVSKRRRNGGGATTDPGRLEATYTYCDATGTPVGRKHKYRHPDGSKTFRWEHPQSPYGDTWGNGLGGRPASSMPLYRLDELLAAPPDAVGYVGEGESDVDRLAKLGVVATCSPNGSAGPPDDIHALAGRDVRIIVDRDEPGVRSGRKWQAALKGVARSVTVWLPKPEGKGADVSDHLDAGHSLDELIPFDTDGDLDLDEEPSGNLPDLTEGQFASVPMGREMARDMRGRFMYVTGIGWHEWDGQRWVKDDVEAVMRWAADWAHERIVRAAQERVEGRQLSQLAKYRETGRVRDLIAGARTADGIVVAAADLDADPNLLNTPSGVVHLPTGELRPHDPALLQTKITGVGYQPDATHSDWNKALEALPSDEVRRFLQVRIGQAAYGEPSPTDELLIQKGGGANGKTAVLGAVQKVLGTYATLMPDSVLVASASRDHPTEMMTLRGARLAFVEELPQGRDLDVARMKKIVGTDEITARLMQRDFVTFPATHTLLINTNYLPRVSETDHGTWRRLVLLEWPFTFRRNDEEVAGPLDRLGDRTLKPRLRKKAQQSAVLAWIVDGARMYAEAGRTLPPPPEAVQQATAAWRDDSDPLGQFIESEYVADPAGVVSCDEMLRQFNAHNSGTDWGAQLFAERLRGHHVWGRLVEKRKTKKLAQKGGSPRWGWAGLRPRMAADGTEQAHDSLQGSKGSRPEHSSPYSGSENQCSGLEPLEPLPESGLVEVEGAPDQAGSADDGAWLAAFIERTSK